MLLTSPTCKPPCKPMHDLARQYTLVSFCSCIFLFAVDDIQSVRVHVLKERFSDGSGHSIVFFELGRETRALNPVVSDKEVMDLSVDEFKSLKRFLGDKQAEIFGTFDRRTVYVVTDPSCNMLLLSVLATLRVPFFFCAVPEASMAQRVSTMLRTLARLVLFDGYEAVNALLRQDVLGPRLFDIDFAAASARQTRAHLAEALGTCAGDDSDAAWKTTDDVAFRLAAYALRVRLTREIFVSMQVLALGPLPDPLPDGALPERTLLPEYCGSLAQGSLAEGSRLAPVGASLSEPLAVSRPFLMTYYKLLQRYVC
jgi:hypothetical protein